MMQIHSPKCPYRMGHPAPVEKVGNMRYGWVRAVAASGLVIVLAGCGGGSTPAGTTSAATASTGAPAATSSASQSSAPASTAGSSVAGGSAAAEAYCQSKGGEVQDRTAYWGTNGDQASWLALAGTTQVCRFQADDEAKSRIYVDLTTLSSSEPTLAALAYLSKVPMPASTGGANPATGYCSKELGGSSTFGAIGASGGGWVAKDDPDDVVVSLCVFPDLSFIDEWGLAYHSDGSVRGIDLATVMAYQPSSLPPVYPVATAAPTS
jgi:putative hemolysin